MLTTSVERLDGNSVKLTVNVPTAEVDSSVERAYKAISKKVKVPGFRPGKAPRTVLDQMVGRDYILAEATEDLVNRTYSRAYDAEGLRPMDDPEIDELDTVEPGAEFTYSATFDVRPEFELSSIDSFEIAVPAKEASDADVDAQIASFRDRFATLEAVEDRAVESGDFVLLSFVGTIEGEPYEGNEVDRYLYEMGQGLMPAEFDEGLVGAALGAQLEIGFTVPENSSIAEYIGKPISFDVTVHEIKRKVLPELDDEFAGNVGFDTLEELREDLATRITAQLRSSYDRVRERRIRSAVAERLEGEAPEALVTKRAESLTRDFVEMLEGQNLSLPAYLQGSGIDEESFFNDMALQAALLVREELALEALARALDIAISDDDLSAEFERIAGIVGITADKARERWTELGLVSALRGEMMQRKAYEWLDQNAVEKTEEPGAASDE